MPTTPAADATSAQALAQQIAAMRDPDSLVRVASGLARAIQSLAAHDQKRVLGAVVPAQAAVPTSGGETTRRQYTVDRPERVTMGKERVVMLRERVDDELFAKYGQNIITFNAARRFAAEWEEATSAGTTRLPRDRYVAAMLEVGGHV